MAQIEFLEWTDADHLRHSKFVGLRDDKNARTVRRKSEAGDQICFYRKIKYRKEANKSF